MKRHFLSTILLISALLCASPKVFASDQPIRFADTNYSQCVTIEDLMDLAASWHADVDPIQLTRGSVKGQLILNDGCGNCVETPEPLWLFLEGANGRFVAQSGLDGRFLFGGIPVGSYQLVTSTGGGKYCHKIRAGISVTQGEVDLGILCIAPDFAYRCVGKCPVGSWAVYFGAEGFSGEGTWIFNADGTFNGTADFLDVDEPPNTHLVNMEGTWSKKTGCAFSFEADITPRGNGGDCAATGTFTSTLGFILDDCAVIQGEFDADVNRNCGDGSEHVTDSGNFAFIRMTPYKASAPAEDDAPSVMDLASSIPQAAPKLAPPPSYYDLNDDGAVDAKDILMLIGQWHLCRPAGPTATPFPNCTSTPTEDGGNGNGPTATPTPISLEGWWEMDWSLTAPFVYSWTTKNQLGDPGEVTEFNMGETFTNVTASYTFNPDTGVMQLTIQGTSMRIGFSGAFSFVATGHLNGARTVISNGTFSGLLYTPLGQKTMTGNFAGYKCCVVGETLNCACNRP